MNPKCEKDIFLPGQTLKEYCDSQPIIQTRPTIVFVNDFPIPRSKWHTITLTSKDIITAHEIVQGGGGGGSDIVNVLLSVALVAAAIVVPELLITESFLGAGLLGASQALVGAGIMLAGSFAMSMMSSNNLATPSYSLPTSVNNSKAIDSASPTYSLSAQNNTARLNQMIPECFGTNLQVLDLGAEPYSRYSGDEEYLQMLLIVGMGHYDIQKIYIEDTVIYSDGQLTGNYADVELEIIEPGESVTLFKPNVQVADEVSGQELEDDGDSLGFFTVSRPGINVDELQVSFAMILAKPEPTTTEQTTYDDGTVVNETTGGGLSNVSLTVLVEAQEIDNLGDPVGSAFTILNKTYSYATYDTKRVTESVSVPLGRYAVKVTRVSTTWTPNENDPDNIEDQIRQQFAWVSAAGFVPTDLTFDEGTMIAFKAKASNSLNQNVARIIKALHQRKLPLWVNGSWSELTATDSAAAAIAYLLRSTYGGRLADQYIDLDALFAIDTDLQSENYGICGIVDSNVKVRSLLADFCAVTNIVLRLTSSGISFVRDIYRDEIKYTFDETNIIKDSFKFTSKFANDITVPDWFAFDYFDPNTGYTLQQVPCKLEDSKNVQPTNKRMYAANRSQAFYAGMRELLAYRYRQRYVEWSTGKEGFCRNFGDIVLISNLVQDFSKRPIVGEVSEVKSKYIYELDRPIKYESGVEHLIFFAKKDGTIHGPILIDSIVVDTNYTLISLNESSYNNAGDFTPVTGFNVNRTKFNIYTGTRKNERVFLTKVSPTSADEIALGGFIDDETVYTEKSYTVPELDIIDEVTKSTKVTGLSVTTIWVTGGVNVTASWSPVSGAQNYIAQWSSDGINWVTAGSPVGTSLSFFVNSAQLFYVRVAAILEFQGPWTTWSGEGVTGAPGTPVPEFVDLTPEGLIQIDWPDVEQAADYAVNVMNGPIIVKTATTVVSEYSTLVVSRIMSMNIQARNSYGSSSFGYISGAIPVPATVTGLAQPDPQTWEITWDASNAVFLTGYIVMIGLTSGFNSANALQILEVDEVTTSATFDSLPAGSYFIRVAAKDIVYDVIGGSLNFAEIEI